MKPNLAWSVLSSVALLMFFGAAHAGVEFNGAIATENFLGVGGKEHRGEFFNFRNANWIQLKLKAAPSDALRAFANLELRNTNFTQVKTVGELWDRGKVEPVSWRVNEAYVDLYGFLLDFEFLSLDLRAGKQIIAWGEADGFNPTNNFDPLNLENPMDLRERVGNVALKASFNVGDDWFTLESVVAPRYLPSVLPIELLLGKDPLNNPLMSGLNPESIQLPFEADMVPPAFGSIRTTSPMMELNNVNAGARLKWSMLDFDWSVSYFHGRDLFPVPQQAAWKFGDNASPCPDPARTCILITDVELIYPRLDVAGMDFRGGIGKVGIWGELAVVFPEKVATAFSPAMLPAQVVISDQPFAKWALGAEYTFTGGFFFNLQWVHGFFTERVGHQLHDYLFLVFRKSLLSERLKFEVTLGGELDTTNHRRGFGGIGIAQVSYKPTDGAELVLGYAMARAQDNKLTLKIFEPLDQVFLKIRADF